MDGWLPTYMHTQKIYIEGGLYCRNNQRKGVYVRTVLLVLLAFVLMCCWRLCCCVQFQYNIHHHDTARYLHY